MLVQHIHNSDVSFIGIVTDLINALLGNSSVNTVQHATIVEVVFSMSSAPTSGGYRPCDVFSVGSH
jgi:hypothetical protein